MPEPLFTLRPFTQADEEAARQVMNAESRALGRGDDFIAAEWRAFLETPRLEPARNIVLAVTGDDTIIGLSNLEYEFDEAEHSIEVWADCGIDPAWWGRGVGTALIAWGEARGLALADERAAAEEQGVADARETAHSAVPIRMRRFVPDHHTQGKALLAANTYPLLRVFYRMRVELAAWDEPVPTLPAGLEPRPVDFERQGEAIYQAHQEIWRDHWGFTPEIWPYFRQMVFEAPGADATLCQAVWEVATDQIAAFTICHPYSADKHDLGWVSLLGTRRAYRKQGIGRALLLGAFAEFKRRGYEAVMLGVDADSPTGALGLYENAGMHIHEQRLIYEKVLR